MSATPTDIANRALDAALVNVELGDIEEGSRTSNVCNRAYGPALRQLLRAAPWQFARRDVPLVLLADATGNTPNVKTKVPSGFTYAYGQPLDLARIRFIPWIPFQNPPIPPSNIVPSSNTSPLTTGEQPVVGFRQVPSRFLITSDPNFTSPAGATDYAAGESPQGNTIICSNVPNAKIVYTYNALYPSIWDSHFTEAMVAYLAQQIAGPLWVDKDRAFGLKVRDEQIAIAKQKLNEARVTDGNQTWSSSDIPVDWINARRTGGASWSGYGGWGAGGGEGWGCWGGGWAGSCDFGNGSSY